jgi:hypothetical protein
LKPKVVEYSKRIEGSDVHAVRGVHPKIRYRENSAFRWTTGTVKQYALRSARLNGSIAPRAEISLPPIRI